jgi:hypothetical protein
MNLSNLLKLLGISIFLSLNAAAAEDEEVATAAELARLDASRLELEAKFARQMDAQIEKWIEVHLDPVLEERMTQSLRPQSHEQNRLADRRVRQGDPSPAAIPAFPQDLPSDGTDQSSNTTCEMVGRTLECVLRRPATE